MPKGCIYFYGLSNQPFQKVTKVMCWDGVSKIRATNPSYLHHVVKLPRQVFVDYYNWKNDYLDTQELLQLALKHQYKNEN